MAVLSAEDTLRSPLGTPMPVHRYIFLGSIILLVVGMPTSTFLTSLPQIILAANWLLEGRLGEKMKRLWSNKAVLLLCSFFVMHLLGLLYTSSAGMAYGMEDVQKKLPLLVLPLVFGTSTHTLTKKEIRAIMVFFMLSITYVTILGTYILMTQKLDDIHEISPYVDSVRLAMMIVLSVFLLLDYVFKHKWSWLSLVLLLWAGWLFAFVFLVQSLTELIVSCVLAVLISGYHAWKQIKQKKMAFGLAFFITASVVIVGSVGYMVHFYNKYFPKPDKVVFSRLDKTTAQGNLYTNDTTNLGTENGHYVDIYICWPELKKAWEQRSKIPFDSNDIKGNQVKYTLIRYMASKGLKKDAEGMSHMTNHDIKAVELGMPNYAFSSLTSMPYRIYQVIWGFEDYRLGGNPNGHSFIQRLEYWKAALGIIKKHPVIGVGTGDVRIAFANQYNETHSKLTEKFRLRSHNQWLEIGVAFGIIGMIWLFLTLFYPAFKTRKIYTYAYFVFWVILMISICTEDTFETEAGATFFAFFNAFLLFLV